MNFNFTDRFPNDSNKERLEKEKKFKQVAEAYAVLSDAENRNRYDNGEELDEIGYIVTNEEDFNPNVYTYILSSPDFY